MGSLVIRVSVSKVAMAVGTSANNKDQGQPIWLPF
jgi:hypothetical protein